MAGKIDMKRTQEQPKGNKADATRRALLDAALRVIGEKGYSAATVNQIVKEAGVSKGLAYYHFKSKAEIAQSILDEGIGSLVDDLDHAANRAETAQAALVAMIELFAARIFENSAFGRFFVSELWRDGRAWSEEMRKYEERLITLLQQQFERGKREGLVRDDLDPTFVAVAIVGMILTTSLYYINGTSFAELPDGEFSNKEAFIRRVTDFVRGAVS